MATLDEIFASMPEETGLTHELLEIDADARQVNIPAAELILGVESDGKAETKYFSCPRYVGKGVDLAACYLRVNYRNANGEVDAHLVNDLTTDGDMVYFSWELAKKVTLYKGVVQFLVCACSAADSTVEWHTTLATGTVLEGLEPDAEAAAAATADVIAQLLALVTSQTAAVEAAGAEQVQAVQTEGDTQVQAVQTAAANAEAAALAEIAAKGANTAASIPADYTALSAQVDKNTRSHAGAIVCAAEGTAIQVNDASDNYLAGLRLFGKSTQDGTPTPEAPVEIVSLPAPVVRVCGKNLLPWPYKDGETKTHGGLTYTVQDDGGVHVTGTVTAAESYFVLADFNFGESSAAMGKSNGVYIWTDCLYNKGRHYTLLYFTQGDEVDRVYYPMVEIGTTATEYEAAAGQTLTLANGLPGIPVASGGNYTDANGQAWICDEVDLARGVYVQRVGALTLDNNMEYYYDGVNGFFHTQANLADVVTWESRLLCSHFVAIGGSVTMHSNGWLQFGSDKGVRFKPGIFTTLEDLATWLQENPVTVQYVLASPVETALSEVELAAWAALHSVKPTTTILNDAGAHTAAEYVADTKLYIDGKLAEIAATLAT